MSGPDAAAGDQREPRGAPKARRSILAADSRARFVASLKDFASSHDGPKAILLLTGLVAMLLGMNGLNVYSSYIGRDFMTAVASRESAMMAHETVRYASILFLSTAAAAVFRFFEERLALLWRGFLTNRLVDLYLRRRFYHRMGSSGHLANPDQRIADDVRLFTQTTLAFLLMIVNATISVLAFSGVMWSISPLLFFVSVTYALVGSAVTIWVGKPLIWINYRQFDVEAELRADLVQLRENSEFVALAHHERHFHERLRRRVDRVVRNYRRLVGVNFGLNTFTNGYNYYQAIVPVLIVAPLYMRGEVEFGVITQSTMAFAQLLGGFSLIVTQFQSISSFTAVVARLDRFSEAARADEASEPGLVVVDGNDGLLFDHVTLLAPEGDKVLVEDLSLHLERGQHLLVTGPGEMAKMAFFRSAAGLWEHGTGRIVRPAERCLCFLPERPYLPPGTLREILLTPGHVRTVDPPRVAALLATLELEESVARIGGLDVERDWDDILSLGELQRFAVARVLLVAPDFALLDRIETTLGAEHMAVVLDLLDAAGISYVTIGRTDSDPRHYDRVLELSGSGPWTIR